MAGALINSANALQAAKLGLEGIAEFKGLDSNKVLKSVQELDLVKNGLLSIGEASISLKNLLATGFTLEQSIELMKRFGDAAAFGRQGSLEFGYAIVSATEGLKNQNSILVDNAGVTKNLSVILKENGYSAQDLSKITSDLGVRTALYNGLLKETQGQLGDASKLSQEFAGKQAAFNVLIEKGKQFLGEFLQAALGPVIDGFIKYVNEMKAMISETIGGEREFNNLKTTLKNLVQSGINLMFKGFKELQPIVKEIYKNTKDLIKAAGEAGLLGTLKDLAKKGFEGVITASKIFYYWILSVQRVIAKVITEYQKFKDTLESVKSTIGDVVDAVKNIYNVFAKPVSGVFANSVLRIFDVVYDKIMSFVNSLPHRIKQFLFGAEGGEQIAKTPTRLKKENRRIGGDAFTFSDETSPGDESGSTGRGSKEKIEKEKNAVKEINKKFKKEILLAKNKEQLNDSLLKSKIDEVTKGFELAKSIEDQNKLYALQKELTDKIRGDQQAIRKLLASQYEEQLRIIDAQRLRAQSPTQSKPDSAFQFERAQKAGDGVAQQSDADSERRTFLDIINDLKEGISTFLGEIVTGFGLKADSTFAVVADHFSRIENIVKGIVGLFQTIKTTVEAINLVTSFLPFLNEGTSNFPGGFAIVGDGPGGRITPYTEAVELPKGSKVHPNKSLMEMIGFAERKQNTNINNNYFAIRFDGDNWVQEKINENKAKSIFRRLD